ncbi:hypothetical protein EPA93_04580 [Ktedonosporobacter rubrisoli]|uniref:Uncharacterized protein n=1 Tax=Ktedonosporobacter rubrisoli TaxID=2509675 RepID=A0A4V0YY82_KTERU|nr:hypothetical protein [Ktedonosporobacter rubrisoli]QBD75311.1 hypothetical protein EPA93_04580 [Ktedonosporobacter rubrisoli]
MPKTFVAPERAREFELGTPTRWLGYAAFAWGLLSGLNHAYVNFIQDFNQAIHASIGIFLLVALPSLLYWAGAFVALALVSKWGRKIPRLLLLILIYILDLVFLKFGTGPILSAIQGRTADSQLFYTWGCWVLLGAILFICLSISATRALVIQRRSRPAS